jgi:hypothetical protein
MDMLKNYTIMSLGYNCSMKNYIKLYIDQPTYIFDWIGSPMWGINKFINDDFNLFNVNDYGPVKIWNTKKDIIFCNKKYYFKFIHDLPPELDLNKTLISYNKYGDVIKINYFTTFKEKYQRRIDKFREMLKSPKPIIFFRMDENMLDKLNHEEYIEAYSISELDYIKEFLNIMKNKYPIFNFKFIFFSKIHENQLCENLLILNHNLDTSDSEFNKKLDIIMNNNKELINKLSC